MKAIWGICIGAALVVAGFIAWTYTVAPDDIAGAGLVFFLVDGGVAASIAITMVVCEGRYEGALRQKWRAWRHQMLGFVVWVGGQGRHDADDEWRVGAVARLGLDGVQRGVQPAWCGNIANDRSSVSGVDM